MELNQYAIADPENVAMTTALPLSMSAQRRTSQTDCTEKITPETPCTHRDVLLPSPQFPPEPQLSSQDEDFISDDNDGIQGDLTVTLPKQGGRKKTGGKTGETTGETDKTK